MIAVEQRRWIARLIKAGLAGVAVLVVLAWIGSKRDFEPDIRIEGAGDARIEATTVPAVATLAPGDHRIFNRDSSVNLILRGEEILAGLSPQMRARIEQEIARSTSQESTGFGAAIASVVKTTVASAIGTHAAISLRDIRDIEYSEGRMMIIRRDGRRTELLGNVKSDGEEISRTFPREDAERFVEAVRARKRELGIP